MDKQMMRSGRRARVDLIDGFLDAGKTTLIRRYVEYLDAQGISCVVLENEFGAAGVDARLLGGNVRELPGGCICCGQKVNFHNLLIELSAEADRIIVEPSGIFNADDFFDIMDSQEVGRVAECGMMIGVVDPFSLKDMTEADLSVLYDELICAGAVVLSRTDRADETTVDGARQTISRLLGEEIPVLDVWAAGFDEMQAYAPVRRRHTRRLVDHSTLFQSTVIRPERVYTELEIRGIVGRLIFGEAGNILRVKGAVGAADGGMLTVNAAGGDIEILTGCGPAMLSVIGREVSRKRLKELLNEPAE